MTIQQCAARLRGRECSSLQLTQECLERIARLDPGLNAFITVMTASALDRASRMDGEIAAGRLRGPLHGIPVAVKDVFETNGTLTTAGSRIYASYMPHRDAAVVEKLEAAGAVIVGKTNMHELAYGITSNNPHYGAVRNPWDTQRVAGGSSGGSAAAVSAGMVPLAMGSDTGGSIRIPASFCGTVGLKPTFGRVSCFGALPLDYTLGHMGPITGSVRDAALALEAVAGHDPRDPFSSRRPAGSYLPNESENVRGLRIGIPNDECLGSACDDTAAAVLRMADLAASLGARLVPVQLREVPELNTLGRTVLLAEAAAILGPYLSRRQDFGADVLALVEQGSRIPATEYANAQHLRRLKSLEFRAVWRQADCLFLPTTPTPAPEIGRTTLAVRGEIVDLRLATTYFTRPFNVLGLPALSMPAGFNSRGLPLGLQIVGKPFDEATVLRAAAALEDAAATEPRTPLLSA